jgi:hypothetical protein
MILNMNVWNKTTKTIIAIDMKSENSFKLKSTININNIKHIVNQETTILGAVGFNITLSILLPLFIMLKRLLCFAGKCPTVCVTRAGAGGGTPSDWENAQA